MKNLYFVLIGFFLFTACSASTYVYNQPEKFDDGIESSTLTKEGFDSLKIIALINKINDGSFPGVHSVLIARHNKLVLEQYFSEWTKDKPHNLYSAGKSIASALFGLAVDRKLISVNTSLLKFFEDYYPSIENVDSLKRQIKLHHLLTMTSGLQVGTFGDKNTDIAITMNKSYKPLKAFLDLPMEAKPGELFKYNDALPIVITNVENLVLKGKMTEFENQYFYGPLGINTKNIMAGLRSRDFLKVGLLYINKGIWSGERILSEEWIKESTSIKVKPASSPWFSNGYGYYWWQNSFKYKEREVDCYFASGNGHQMLYIIPELDLIVLFTGGNINNDVAWDQPHRMLQDYIISAVN